MAPTTDASQSLSELAFVSSEVDSSHSGSGGDDDYETDASEVDDEFLKKAWMVADPDHSPEYYVKQQEELDAAQVVEEDYAVGTTRLLDTCERQWFRYCRYIRQQPDGAYAQLSKGLLGSFFDWWLNQRRGKNGRKLRGTKKSSSLGSYWKNFRLVYERATGNKIDPFLKRQMHKVLRKLAKKHGLSKQPADKPPMYVDDLVEVLQTNVSTVEKQYAHGQVRIDIHTMILLAFPTAQRPEALLHLRYRHIQVTLLRDPGGGPPNLLLEFTFEFTKQFLGMKAATTFPIPEIICDPSLILSPHVFLLGRLFADRAFAASGLRGPEGLSELDVPPGCNELRLNLKDELADVPVFRQPIKTLHGWKISTTQPMTYAILYNGMKAIGEITGIRQIVRPYTLRYGGGNAFDANGQVSDALRNMMMQHSDTRTFLRHYLARRVTVDTLSIVRGREPQDALMHAACRMSRSVDPRRPRKLTPAQASSVNDDPEIRSLVEDRARLKNLLRSHTMQNEEYGRLGREVCNARQRLRCSLLWEVKTTWEKEQAVADIEFQLSGGKFQPNVDTDLGTPDERRPEHKRLIQTIMTLPGGTLEEERSRRDAAIAAVTAYCAAEEGGPRRGPRPRCHQGLAAISSSVEESLNTPGPDPEYSHQQKILADAMVSVCREKRPTVCFLCLGNDRLDFDKRVHSFATPGDLSKHFRRRHLANIRKEDVLGCGVCILELDDQMHLQNHALRIHGTVS